MIMFIRGLNSILVFLVLLTLTSVFLYLSNVITHSEGLIMFISFIKIMMVAMYFMELKKAHLFWRLSLLFLIGIIIVSAFVLKS